MTEFNIKLGFNLFFFFLYDGSRSLCSLLYGNHHHRRHLQQRCDTRRRFQNQHWIKPKQAIAFLNGLLSYLDTKCKHVNFYRSLDDAKLYVFLHNSLLN